MTKKPEFITIKWENVSIRISSEEKAFQYYDNAGNLLGGGPLHHLIQLLNTLIADE